MPGDPGVPPALTSTYYKAIAPRLGIAYSPNFSGGFLGKLFGGSGATSIRAGWGIFYNPIEELVLAQFGAEPPFGGSSSLFDTIFNTPFVYQAGGATPAPNPFNGIITPTPGQPTDYSFYRPILLYGEFQPHLRTQYTTAIQPDDSAATYKRHDVAAWDMWGQRDIGCWLRMTSIHRIRRLASISQYCGGNANNVTAGNGGAAATCGPFVEDAPFYIPPGTVLPNALHLPYANNNGVLPAGYTVGSQGLTLVGLRPYSSPNCNPITGAGCPVDGIPIFSDIFAEDTIANSAYNAFEAMLEKRFSHGLQFQASYTLSKSLDEGSTFEETLNPFNPKASRACHFSIRSNAL